MKIRIITIILILIAFSGYGQTSDVVSAKKISLGLIFSPDYCYRVLNSESRQVVVDVRNSGELPRLGFTAGLSLLLKPWKRVSVETGLLYSDKGMKTKIFDLRSVPDPALPTSRFQFIYHYNYLDIPTKVNYVILKGKMEIFLSAGLSTNIYLFQRTKIRYFDSEKPSTYSNSGDFSKLNFAVLIGGGIDYHIKDRLSFRLEPIFRRSITPNSDSLVKEYQYSIGSNLGLLYALR